MIVKIKHTKVNMKISVNLETAKIKKTNVEVNWKLIKMIWLLTIFNKMGKKEESEFD